MGDGVEEAGGGHPARLTRVLRHHPGERLALLRRRLRERAVEHARVGPRQVLCRQQAVDVRERTAVDRRAGHEVGGEAAADTPDRRHQGGERPPVSLGRDARGAVRLQAGEPDRAAHGVRHAAALAVVAQRQRAVVLVVVYLHVSVVARLRGALVGGSHAGLGDERARDGGAPERLARPGHDGPALRQRLLGEGPPHGVGEVAAEMGQPHHRVLGAVHAARQRRHQGDRRDDSDDRPGAEAEAPFARGVHDAGGGVPDQQETRQDQDAGVEREQHVADSGRPVPAEAAQEREHVAGRAVGVGKQPPVDRLPERRFGRRNGGQGEAAERQHQQQDRQTSRDDRRPFLSPVPVPRLSQCSQQQGRIPPRVRKRAAELWREQEAERAHRLSWRPRAGWRGREGGACPPRRARAMPRRWRRASRPCASAASRASARPPGA